MDPCRKLILHKPEDIRRVGKPRLMWLESVEEDLRNVGVRNCRLKSQGREQGRAILEGAEVGQEL
jgi:hypothetical protein